VVKPAPGLDLAGDPRVPKQVVHPAGELRRTAGRVLDLVQLFRKTVEVVYSLGGFGRADARGASLPVRRYAQDGISLLIQRAQFGKELPGRNLLEGQSRCPV